ncbi:MAG: hypothetical protein WAX69_17650, partial [Victivallales bacterium]
KVCHFRRKWLEALSAKEPYLIALNKADTPSLTLTKMRIVDRAKARPYFKRGYSKTINNSLNHRRRVS